MKPTIGLFFSFTNMIITTFANQGCGGFPSSMDPFTAIFKEPIPPMLKSEFNTSFMQHKWNEDVSHITSGYMYNLPEQHKVRVDQAYGGYLSSSIFNYANIAKDGLVDNILTNFPSDGNYSEPQTFRGYVNPGFPLLMGDLLTSYNATFGGLTRRELIPDQVAKWYIMYQGVIPATIYIDACNVVVGYDFFSESVRTYVITKFFNIQVA